MTHNPAADTPLRSAVANAAATACRRIAPSWPLDRFVAVNPYWGWTAQPIETVDARLAHLGGSSLRMSRNFYRSAWQRDTIRYQDLRTAIQEAGRDDEPDELVATLSSKPTYVHGLAKRQVHSVRPPNLDQSMQQAIHHAIAAYNEPETQRRVEEFFE